MNEFKEKLIFEIMDDLQDKILDMYQLSKGYLDGKRLRDVIRHTVKEKLNDLIVIDRNKFKEKINVVNYAPFVLDIENPNEALVSRLHFMQWITPESIAMVDMDIIKDRFKDAFIAKLEECDF